MIFDAGRQYQSLDEWLASEPVEIERPTVEELVKLLEKTKRKNSLPVVRSLLRYADCTTAVEGVRRRIAKCGNGGVGWTTQGYKWIRFSCDWVGCPRCSPRLKARESQKVYSAIELRLGRAPDPDEVSYLSIHISYAGLGSDFSDDREDFRKRLRRILRQLPYKVSVCLEFEVAPQHDLMGKFHAHGWLLHPTGARDEIEEKLKATFDGHKVVDLQAPYSDFVMGEILHSAEYQADVDLTLKGFGNDTPQVLADLIHSIESVRSRGRQGLRFKFNMKPAQISDTELIEGAEPLGDSA
jgi:hypothetical protein